MSTNRNRTLRYVVKPCYHEEAAELGSAFCVERTSGVGWRGEIAYFVAKRDAELFAKIKERTDTGEDITTEEAVSLFG